MKIHQVSLFLENKPGHLRSVVQILADAQINIVTLSLADTQQFGILRLIVEDWQTARSVLEKTGCVVNVTEVVATEVEDRPGGLAAVLKLLEQGQVNVEYMYAFTFGKGDRAVMVFRFDQPDAAIELLQQAGVSVLGSVELFRRAK
ncbi:MAG: ACT domain-containing protein [Thermoguttaceae bacterium]